MKTAGDLGIPERFNATTYFIDRHLAEGRAAKVAIECGDERVTYGELAERVNRCGSAPAVIEGKSSVGSTTRLVE